MAYYTRIPPGDYRFRVSAANGDGVWSDTEASVPFRIEPYFHQTAWFPPAVALLLIGLGVLGHRARLRQVAAQNLRLAAVVEERTDELAVANRELRRLAESDSLTGVANRRKLDEALEAEWRRGQRQGTPVTLVLIDLDFFKQFNDAYGHQEGDRVLMRIASVLDEHARRSGDLVARYGGEEFVVLLPTIAFADAVTYAEQLRDRVEATALPHGESPVSGSVTISIGLATALPHQGGAVDALMRRADEALYRAKHEGRNRVVAVDLGEAPETESGALPAR